MTRINTIHPSMLSHKHLLAEYRELPRIFGLVRNAIERGERPDDPRNPKEFKLSTGHCRFFYNKLQYLLNRQKSIIRECLRRGINIEHDDPSSLIKGIPDEWINDWKPDLEAHRKSIARINERGGLKTNNAEEILGE